MVVEQNKTTGEKNLLTGKYNLIMNITPQGEIYDVYDGGYHIACICFYADRMECFMNYRTFSDSIYKHTYGDISLTDKDLDIKRSLMGLSLRVHSMYRRYYILCDDEKLCKGCGEVVNIESSQCKKCRESQRGV